MTIHLSKELEQFVHGAIEAGRYATEDEVVKDALVRLEQEMLRTADVAVQRSNPGKLSDEKRLIDVLNQRLLAGGLISQLPDPAQDASDDDPDDQPIEIVGEPLSETIIRERR